MADWRQEDKHSFETLFDQHEAWGSHEMPNNIQAERDSSCLSVHLLTLQDMSKYFLDGQSKKPIRHPQQRHSYKHFLPQKDHDRNSVGY